MDNGHVESTERLGAAAITEGLGARKWAAVAVAIGFVWCLVAWFWSRAPELAYDWMGWRQADTQAIARNLLRPGGNVLWPQIDWGGDGPGYVEAEFQLYAALVASLMSVVGVAEWPGQLISLLAVVGAATSVFLHHARREGEFAAFAAVLTFLGARAVAQLATSVQPDAFSMLSYTLAWHAFVGYVERESIASLVLFALWGALAMLVKPTAAHIGISSGLLLLFAKPQLLKKWHIWAAWALMVGALALYLAHAQSLYAQYGNTFGLFSGGDSKSPRLSHLLNPKLLGQAVARAVVFGTSVVGALALIRLTMLRKVGTELLALSAGNLAISLLALRYTSQAEGSHYFAPTAVLGAGAVARLVAVGLPSGAAGFGSSLKMRSPRVLAAVLIGLCMAQLILVEWKRHKSVDMHAMVINIVDVGRALKKHTRDGSLVIIRSHEESYDEEWKTANNFQDPRVFYVAEVRGWSVPSDKCEPADVEKLVQRGARYLANTFPEPKPNALNSWLEQHAELLETTPLGGEVWRLSKR